MSGFDWSSVGLDKIDTSADYEYVAGEGLTYVMNFTNDGEVLVKKNGVIDAEIDAKDQNNISNGKIKFNYNVGVETDIILTMNGDNVDAELLALDMTATYVKKTGDETEPPVDLAKDRVYGPTNSIYFVLTTDNQIKGVYNGSILDNISCDEIEIYEGTLAQLIEQRFPEYESYEIETGADQFGKYVIGDGKLVGAFNDLETVYYVMDASERNGIQVGDSFELDSSLTLEDFIQ